MTVKLKAAQRQDLRSSATKQLRSEGQIPSVVYSKGGEAQAISVDNIELLKTVRDEGRNAVISLDIENDKTIDVMLHEYQTHPVRRDVIHADFYEFDASAEMDVSVALNLVGEASGVRAGGILQQPFYELEVRAKPKNIPEEITVDVSALEIGDSIAIADLPVSEEYEFIDEAETAIAVILPPAEEEEETDPTADVSLEPEVIGAKEEDEDEE